MIMHLFAFFVQQVQLSAPYIKYCVYTYNIPSRVCVSPYSLAAAAAAAWSVFIPSELRFLGDVRLHREQQVPLGFLEELKRH